MGRRPLLALAVVSALIFQLMGASGAAAGDETEGPSFLSRHRRPLMVASGVGAAATGLAAVFFRRAANDRFETYQRTADPERLAELYDRAAELDNRASASFIAAEACFVFAIYLGFFVDPPRKVARVESDVSDGEMGIAWIPERGPALRVQWSF
jgi:hypothetical protein